MKIILKIFKNDLIGIKGSILTIVLAVGLCILPALYAWFNIFANGDPYANTGNINIAVVNLDKGSDDGSGNIVNMGQSVTDKLKEQTSIGWVFPDSEDAAIEGVKSGKFYAAVVIDADFSSNMYNALTDNFINPSFTYYENEKKNAVAPKITDTAVSTLKTSINETYIKAISEKLLSSLDNSDTQLSADINSGTFVTSLKTLDDNLAGYQDMITSIIKANKKLVKDNNLKAASTKNTRKPTEISRLSQYPVWWKGICGHEWKDKVFHRAVEGAGCIYCEKAFLKELPYLLVTMYAKQYGLATRTDDEKLIGARIDAVIPELRLAFAFSQKGTDREAKVAEVLHFLCKAKRIQLFVIRQKDPIALATEIKQAFTKANLFINSDSQRDVAHLRKRYFAQKNNGN